MKGKIGITKLVDCINFKDAPVGEFFIPKIYFPGAFGEDNNEVIFSIHQKCSTKESFCINVDEMSITIEEFNDDEKIIPVLIEDFDINISFENILE